MALDATIGGASADTYATLAEYQAYGVLYGWTLSGVDATDEINLRKARVYLDNAYTWKGYKATDAQALRWPRVVGGYVDSYAVPSDTIPQAIKDAQCEMAYLIQGGATPYATIDSGAVISKRERVDVIEEATTYAAGTSRDRDAYPVVDQLVSEYAVSKAGSSGSMMLRRA